MDQGIEHPRLAEGEGGDLCVGTSEPGRCHRRGGGRGVDLPGRGDIDPEDAGVRKGVAHQGERGLS